MWKPISGKMWKELIRSQKDIELTSEFKNKINKIVDSAKKELLI